MGSYETLLNPIKPYKKGWGHRGNLGFPITYLWTGTDLMDNGLIGQLVSTGLN
jgi:hypothetical protein